MSFSDKTRPIRVTAYPELGEPLLKIRQPIPPPELVPLPVARFDERLVVRLDAILEEIEGLRADLASRTVGARLRRVWAWMRATARF